MNILERYNVQFFILFSGLITVTLPLKENYNSIAIILFLTSQALFFLKGRNSAIALSKGAFIFVLPFIYLVFQVFYSDYDVYQRNLLRALPILLFPIFFSIIRGQYENAVPRILKILVLSALGYSSFLILFAFYRQLNFSPDFSNINWYFFAYRDFTAVLNIHPTYLGMYNCLAFSVIAYNVFKRNKLLPSDIVSILILTVVIILAGSRISLICQILIFCYLLFSNFTRIGRKPKLLFLLFFIVVPTMIFTYVPIAKERMVDMTFGLKETYAYAKYGENVKYAGSIAPRLELWKCALEAASNNYVFGNGFGNTQKLLNECYKSKGFDHYAQLNYQTHNQYLSSFARGGIMGLGVILIVLLFPLFLAIKNKNYLYVSFLIIILVCCLTENVLNRHFGIVFYAFFNSLFYFIPNKKLES